MSGLAEECGSVFINCPFDADYLPVFHSIVFTLAVCGLTPPCALEHEDAGMVRIEKIYRLIDKCEFGIHDVSRTELDSINQLPRFNMPLELGLFLGAKKYGTKRHKAKKCLILDQERYRFQKFISDIAGQDIKAHERQPKKAITAVRDWLRGIPGHGHLPGGAHIWSLYQRFRDELPALCEATKLEVAELVFSDFLGLVLKWLSDNLPAKG